MLNSPFSSQLEAMFAFAFASHHPSHLWLVSEILGAAPDLVRQATLQQQQQRQYKDEEASSSKFHLCMFWLLVNIWLIWWWWQDGGWAISKHFIITLLDSLQFMKWFHFLLFHFDYSTTYVINLCLSSPLSLLNGWMNVDPNQCTIQSTLFLCSL